MISWLEERRQSYASTFQRSPRCPKFFTTMWCQSHERGFLQLVAYMDGFLCLWLRYHFQSRRLTLQGGRLSLLRLPLESIDYSKRSLQRIGIPKGRRFRARRWFVDLGIINSRAAALILAILKGFGLSQTAVSCRSDMSRSLASFASSDSFPAGTAGPSSESESMSYALK